MAYDHWFDFLAVFKNAAVVFYSRLNPENQPGSDAG